MARVLTNENNYYNIADTIRQMKNVNTTYKPREISSSVRQGITVYNNKDNKNEFLLCNLQTISAYFKK